MHVDAQQILTAFACFLFGGMLVYAMMAQRHADEVREWKAIARKAQRLNSLADTLEQERSADAQRQYKN